MKKNLKKMMHLLNKVKNLKGKRKKKMMMINEQKDQKKTKDLVIIVEYI